MIGLVDEWLDSGEWCRGLGVTRTVRRIAGVRLQSSSRQIDHVL